jgi:isochorismate pyruvate lyase
MMPDAFPAPVPAIACTTMADVRAQIDRLDTVLVALIAERQSYMDAAARIKPALSAVRDQARIDDVMAKVLAAADASGLSPAIAGPVWQVMIDRCIAYEHQAFEALRAPAASSDPAAQTG